MVVTVALTPVEAELHGGVQLALAAKGKGGLAALGRAEVFFGYVYDRIGAHLHGDVVRHTRRLKETLGDIHSPRTWPVAAHSDDSSLNTEV